MKSLICGKAVVLVTFLLNCAQALQSPFDAIHEARKRNAQNQRKLADTFNGAITGFSLIDTVTDTKIASLANGTIIYVTNRTGSSFSINASFAGSGIGSVKFGHNGNSNVHIERFAWYSFCGNLGKDFFNCSALGVGNHTVTATPYSKQNAGGKAGTPYTVSFSIMSNKTKVSPPIAAPIVKAPVSTFVPAPFPADAPSHRFKPRFNLTALSPLKVNVTKGPVTVELRVTMEDEVTEVFMSAVGSKSQFSVSDYCSAPRVPVAGPFICNISLTFPPFIVPGNYSLELEGFIATTENYFVVSSAELKNRRLPYAVEVVNKLVDTTPPQLLDLRARSSTTVNVTTRSAKVDLVVVVQDDLSQFRYGYIGAIDPEGSLLDQAYFGLGDFPYNNSVAGKPMTFNTSFYLSNYNRPGKYSLQVFLIDTVGNRMETNASTLAQRAFPSSFTIINANYDGTPPVILKPIEISPSSVNVTLRPATIDIQLLVQDDSSGVQSAYASLYNPALSGGFQEYTAYYFADVPVAGKPVPISMSLVVPRYARAGRYALSLQVSDVRGNTYDSQQANKTLFVDVFNTLDDVSPPKLLSLVALTPTTVNASSPLRSVTYKVVVQDAMSGIKSVDLSAYSAQGSGSIYDPVFSGYLETPIVGQPATFNISLQVKQSTKPGKYRLRLEVADAAGNYINFNSDQLAARNMSSTIDVVNPEYDGKAPDLKNLVLLSSSKVNVTLAPAKIELQLFVQDDISGFKYGTVELYSPDDPSFGDREVAPDQASRASGVLRRTSERRSEVGKERDLLTAYGYLVSNVTVVASKKVAGKATAYNVSLTVPKFAMPGAYLLNINLFDFADNGAYFASSELSSLSFPSKIEVSNAIVDSEPPALVSFTTRSPSVVNVKSGPVTVEFQAVALDALSGVTFVYSAISGPGISGPGSSEFYNSTEVTFDKPIAGQPVTFNISFTLEPSLRSGVYSLEVAVLDAALQYIYLSTKDLISLGFAGNLTVISNT
jgi:Bacterial Ig-like domain